MSGPINVKMNFKVTEDMKSKLDLMAENENKKVSEIIRESITEKLEKYENPEYEIALTNKKIEFLKKFLTNELCIFSKSTKTKVLLLFDDYEITILNLDDIKKCILLTLYKDKEVITSIELDKNTCTSVSFETQNGVKMSKLTIEV